MPRRLIYLLLLAILALFLVSTTAQPYGGGGDRYGCRPDGKQGGHRCPQGLLAGQPFASQSDMLATLQQGPAKSADPPTMAGEFSGKVVRVIEGDTLEVMHKGQAERVRLNGIDCPERGQAYGNHAKKFTSQRVFGKQVTVKTYGLDQGRRTMGEVILPSGMSLNRELVKAGLAWWNQKSAPHDETLKRLEEEARNKKRGLWADPTPVPPWCYRTRQQGCP